MAINTRDKRSDDDEAEADADDVRADAEEGTSDSDASDGQGELDASALANTDDEGDEDDEEGPAGQLGAQRYVTAGFFAAGLLGAFVIGKTIHGVWGNLAARDWFASSLPTLAAVEDGGRSTYGMLLGVLIAVVLVVRLYRRADVREWTDEIAGELAKVKWPNRKEVYNSTVVVIAASAIFTTYLALLDRLWAFVTNLVYGTGV